MKEKEKMSRDIGSESVPVGITRIERSQERARDPRQKTINTDFANSYTPPERCVALVQSAHIPCTIRTHPHLCLPTRLMATALNDRPLLVCVDCCAHVRLFNPPIRLLPFIFPRRILTDLQSLQWTMQKAR